MSYACLKPFRTYSFRETGAVPPKTGNRPRSQQEHLQMPCNTEFVMAMRPLNPGDDLFIAVALTTTWVKISSEIPTRSPLDANRPHIIFQDEVFQ